MRVRPGHVISVETWSGLYWVTQFPLCFVGITALVTTVYFSHPWVISIWPTTFDPSSINQYSRPIDSAWSRLNFIRLIWLLAYTISAFFNKLNWLFPKPSVVIRHQRLMLDNPSTAATTWVQHECLPFGYLNINTHNVFANPTYGSTMRIGWSSLEVLLDLCTIARCNRNGPPIGTFMSLFSTKRTDWMWEFLERERRC